LVRTLVVILVLLQLRHGAILDARQEEMILGFAHGPIAHAINNVEKAKSGKLSIFSHFILDEKTFFSIFYFNFLCFKNVQLGLCLVSSFFLIF